uniref:Uncharacterized protein n=1 Tax=Panagrellus redivivus TaxID=6233 RepID=A0A7E4VKL1_PANRE
MQNSTHFGNTNNAQLPPAMHSNPHPIQKKSTAMAPDKGFRIGGSVGRNVICVTTVFEGRRLHRTLVPLVNRQSPTTANLVES